MNQALRVSDVSCPDELPGSWHAAAVGTLSPEAVRNCTAPGQAETMMASRFFHTMIPKYTAPITYPTVLRAP